jgi:hypothetical protein
MTATHDYLSTACWHAARADSPEEADELHGYCQSDTGLSGTKKAATCKWCDVGCSCECHAGPIEEAAR